MNLKYLFQTATLSLAVTFPLHAPAVAQNIASSSDSALTKQFSESSLSGLAGFSIYTWLRAEDRRDMYSSTVFVEPGSDTLKIYNTYKQKPLGQITRCGGLGCDLGKGSLIATLKLSKRGPSWLVINASEQASFMQDARCMIVETRASSHLECFSQVAPPGMKMPSIIRFEPGT